MNKKQTSSIILASLASIGFASSLIIGGTYALFTSESKTNIAVSSGKVEVVATIDESSLITYSGVDLTGNVETDANKIKPTAELEDGENGKFITGGSATIDGGDLKLDKMVPGDKVTFTINVKNNSTVKVKYRTVFKKSADERLIEKLKVTVDGDVFTGSEDKVGIYRNLLPGTDPDAISVSVELPSDVDNNYQAASCTLTNVVEAIQGNAHISGDVEITDENPLTDENLNSGKPVSLTDDVTVSAPLNITSSATLYGNGQTLKTESDNRVLNINDNAESLTVTLVDVAVDASDIERGITLYGNKNVKLVLDGCNITADHYALNVGSENDNLEIIIKNSTITGYAALNIWSAGTTVKVSNSTLNGLNKWGGTSDSCGVITITQFAVSSDDVSPLLEFNNCKITATENGPANEWFLSKRSTSNIAFKDCSFFYNGSEITNKDNIRSRSRIYNHYYQSHVEDGITVDEVNHDVKGYVKLDESTLEANYKYENQDVIL